MAENLPQPAMKIEAPPHGTIFVYSKSEIDPAHVQVEKLVENCLPLWEPIPASDALGVIFEDVFPVVRANPRSFRVER